MISATALSSVVLSASVYSISGIIPIRAKLKERLPDIGFDIGQAGWNIERDFVNAIKNLRE
jgi:hypothetical protein